MKKIILTLAGFCFLFSAGFAQEIEWQNTIGGNSTDGLNSIQQTSDGGYILGGHSASNISGDKTENSQGTFDYWVIKLDSIGNIQWQNTIGGNDFDMLNSIQQTTDGGFILGGSSISDSSGDKTENNVDTTLSWQDYWVIKLDGSGNIQWQNTIGGTGIDELYAVQQTSDGGYVLGGSSVSDSSGDKTENCIGAGGDDFWVLKIDANGTIQWQNTIGGTNSDELYAIKQTSDGGYVLGGNSHSNISGDKTENNWDTSLVSSDYWVVKLDSTGNIEWDNTIGGKSFDNLYSLQQTTDGGYILGGNSGSNISGDKTENGQGYWVVKLDSAGIIQWQNTITGNSGEILMSIEKAPDGGFILGGYSQSPIAGDKTEFCRGLNDYWVIKIDSIGNILWQKTIGGSKQDNLYSIYKTVDGGVICGGTSWSNISGDKNENSQGGTTDCWVVKITNKFNSITGKLFIDSNSNGMQDAGEIAAVNKAVTEISSGRFNFSNQNGEYLTSVLDSGNFSVSPASINYYNAVPASHAVYFSGIQQTDSLNDFAFQPSGVFNDLCVTISAMGNFRANMNSSYMINYENVGTTTLNGTVIFFPDNDVTYSSSNVTPASVTTDSVVWNVGTLLPFQTGNILVTVHVNAGTPAGTLINSGVVVEPVAGDANTACNYNSSEVLVTGSFDPNAILVDRDTVLTTELSSPPYLNYIIYFQNTGNDTAFNIRVLNNIPQLLDVNSFEFVASSHPMNVTYGAHARLMEFTFDNILLPDSNVNEPASHGFIRYRIKPHSTLVAGDEIHNTAFIYFDFNVPVQTNTAVTEIVLPTGMEAAAVSSGSRQLSLYPNPANDKLIIDSYLLAGKKAEMKIYDLYGREVFQLQTANCKLQTQINVSRFSQGIYFVELQSGEQVLRGKFLKK